MSAQLGGHLIEMFIFVLLVISLLRISKPGSTGEEEENDSSEGSHQNLLFAICILHGAPFQLARMAAIPELRRKLLCRTNPYKNN